MGLGRNFRFWLSTGYLNRTRTGWLTASVLILILGFGLVDLARAADPLSGTIAPLPGSPTIEWSGPARTATTPGPSNAQCEDVGAFCDDFLLTVNVDPSYWESHSGGATIKIAWNLQANDFDLYVFRADCTTLIDSSATAPSTSEVLFIGSAYGSYCVRTVYFMTVGAEYSGTATFSSEIGGPRFDSTRVSFAPASIVSAHFLLTEPQVTIERTTPYSWPGATDPRRIFVDGFTLDTSVPGQLTRSTDGGDTFRLLYDLDCAQRNTPMCTTVRGTDLDNEVNLANGHLMFTNQTGVGTNEAYAHSDDHGDSFQERPITNATTVTDRQWLAATDNSFSALGRTIEGFLSYRAIGTGGYIQGIDAETGEVIPQSTPQILGARLMGQLRVDNNLASPGHGWIYQPHVSPGTSVATAFGPNFADPAAWQTRVVIPSQPNIMPWVAIDGAGNAYAISATGSGVFYSYSRIGEVANNPALGGRPGTSWSSPLRISLPSVGSVVFAEAIGGDAGKIAVVYDGSLDFTGKPDDAPADALWNTYVAVIRDATADAGAPVISTGIASHRPIHQGPICTGGDSCSVDRSLLDLIDLSVDQHGRVAVIFTDNFSTFAHEAAVPSTRYPKEHPFAHFAKQTRGPSLYGDSSMLAPSYAQSGSGSDAAHDATWPNTAGAPNLPALDALGVDVSGRAGAIEGRIALADASLAGMRRDLAAYNATPQSTPLAERIQYVLRFSTGSDIYHLSFEASFDGNTRCFAGKLDANDRIPNPTEGFTAAASYRADAEFPAACSIEKGELRIHVPRSSFGFGRRTKLYSATAFSMAGPAETNESLLHMMRTVDATPPFDKTL